MVFNFNTDFLIYYVLVGLRTYALIYMYEEKPNWYMKCPSRNCSMNYCPFCGASPPQRERAEKNKLADKVI